MIPVPTLAPYCLLDSWATARMLDVRRILRNQYSIFQERESHPLRRLEDNALGNEQHSLSGTYCATIVKHTEIRIYHWTTLVLGLPLIRFPSAGSLLVTVNMLQYSVRLSELPITSLLHLYFTYHCFRYTVP